MHACAYQVHPPIMHAVVMYLFLPYISGTLSTSTVLAIACMYLHTHDCIIKHGPLRRYCSGCKGKPMTKLGAVC